MASGAIAITCWRSVLDCLYHCVPAAAHSRVDTEIVGQVPKLAPYHIW